MCDVAVHRREVWSVPDGRKVGHSTIYVNGLGGKMAVHDIACHRGGVWHHRLDRNVSHWYERRNRWRQRLVGNSRNWIETPGNGGGADRTHIIINSS
jgi:hypothetical protein